jgi:hypothetical protein
MLFRKLTFKYLCTFAALIRIIGLTNKKLIDVVFN